MIYCEKIHVINELTQLIAPFPADARGFDWQEACREAQATATQHAWHCAKLALMLPGLITFPNLPCLFVSLNANRAS